MHTRSSHFKTGELYHAASGLHFHHHWHGSFTKSGLIRKSRTITGNFRGGFTYTNK